MRRRRRAQMLQQLDRAGLSAPAVEQLWQHYEAVRKAEGGDKVAFSTGARRQPLAPLLGSGLCPSASYTY
jgi:hypothetical protein